MSSQQVSVSCYRLFHKMSRGYCFKRPDSISAAVIKSCFMVLLTFYIQIRVRTLRAIYSTESYQPSESRRAIQLHNIPKRKIHQLLSLVAIHWYIERT